MTSTNYIINLNAEAIILATMKRDKPRVRDIRKWEKIRNSLVREISKQKDSHEQ